MEKLENLLRLLFDMESFSHHDKLSEVVADTAARDSDELDEWELESVSAAGEQMYQKFLRKLDELE